MIKRLLIAAALLLFFGTGLFAAQPYLSVSLDADYSALGFATMFKHSEDGIAIEPEGYDEIRETAIRMMLEEARWIFSGMIYGFDFNYIPGNQEEGFEESFVLTPLSLIPAGDPDLKVQQVQDDYRRLRVIFNYWPDDMQARRLSVGRGGGYNSAAGEGGVPMMLENARLDSLEQGVKQALRSDLRTLLYNRPLEVEGRVFLSAAPRIYIRAGEYRSLVTVLYKREDMNTFPPNY